MTADRRHENRRLTDAAVTELTGAVRALTESIQALRTDMRDLVSGVRLELRAVSSTNKLVVACIHDVRAELEHRREQPARAERFAQLDTAVAGDAG